MQFNPHKLFKPSTFALVMVGMSAFAWSFPSFGFLGKGYDVQSPWTLSAVLALFNWYALIYIALRIGESAGRSLFLRLSNRLQIPALDDQLLFLSFTTLAAIGVIATYVKIFSTMSLLEAFLFISSGMGNELKENLYTEYSAGIVSFRYLVLFSASIAVYRLFKFHKVEALTICNLALLMGSALLSSRLIFVATVLCSLFLCLTERARTEIRPLRLAVFVFTVFCVLALLNSSRNANYYEQNDLHFWSAGVSSILTYVGSPFQVAVGTASNITRLASESGDAYRDYVDILPELNTNSAFLQMHQLFGFWAWLYVACLLFVAGLLFAYFKQYGRSALLLPAGAILYASGELWRLDLFRQGIFLVWIGVGTLLPILIGWARPLLISGMASWR